MNEIKIDGVTVATALGCKQSYAPNKIVNTALNGTIYVQNTGKPIDRRLVHAYCESFSDREDLDRASNEGAALTIDWKDRTLLGYIADNISWQEWKDGHGVGAFTFLVDSEE